MRSTTERKTVFANLDDNTEYKFSVRANTRKGYGPWSTQVREKMKGCATRELGALHMYHSMETFTYNNIFLLIL